MKDEWAQLKTLQKKLDALAKLKTDKSRKNEEEDDPKEPEQPPQEDTPVKEESFENWQRRILENPKSLVPLIPDLKPFDVKKYVYPDAAILAIGERRTGKTTVLTWWLYEFRRIFRRGLIQTATRHNQHWMQVCPPRFVWPGFNEAVLQKFHLMQKARTDPHNPKFDPDNPFVFVLLDDVTGDGSIQYQRTALGRTLNTLFSHGRHPKFMVIVSAQYIFGLTPTIRSNPDFVILTEMSYGNQKQEVAKAYMPWWPVATAMSFIDHYTRDHQVIVINMKAKNKIRYGDPASSANQDQLFVYKAPGPVEQCPSYVLGDMEFWGNERPIIPFHYDPKKVALISGASQRLPRVRPPKQKVGRGPKVADILPAAM